MPGKLSSRDTCNMPHNTVLHCCYNILLKWEINWTIKYARQIQSTLHKRRLNMRSSDPRPSLKLERGIGFIRAFHPARRTGSHTLRYRNTRFIH